MKLIQKFIKLREVSETVDSLESIKRLEYVYHSILFLLQLLKEGSVIESFFHACQSAKEDRLFPSLLFTFKEEVCSPNSTWNVEFKV